MSDTKRVIVGLGELLWDLFPQGRVMGGAPANFAFHAAALGDEGVVVSRVGEDALGRELLDRLSGLGLSVAGIQRDETHPTGTVQVELDASGQPHYTITEGVAWDHLAWNDELESLAARTDAVCFGSLAQRHPVSRATIRRFLGSLREGALRVFDVNLRQHFHSGPVLDESLRLADVAKLNLEELPRVLEAVGETPTGEVPSDARSLLGRYALNLVCVTRGEHGSVLVTASEVSEHAGYVVQMADPVGAGDAFTAALVHHYLRGADPARMNKAANRLGSWVAAQVGGTPRAGADVVAAVTG